MAQRRAQIRLPLLLAILSTAAIVAFTGCGGDDDEAAETSAPAQTGPAETAPAEALQVAFFAPLANSYVEATIEGMEEVAAKENVEITRFDTEFDPQKEFSQMQDAVAQGKFDAFIVIPLDPVALVPAAEEAIQAGITVVNTDLALGPDLTTSEPQVEGQAGTVMTPGVARAENITEVLIQACDGVDPCEVGWIAGVATIDFEQKIKERLDEIVKEMPHIKLVSYQDGGGYLSEPAIPIAQNILQANPDLDVLATSGDQMTLGAELAVQDAGRGGEIKLIGGGASCPGIQAVQAGNWFGTTLDVPRDEGVLGMEIAVAHARDEETAPVGLDAQEESGFPRVLTQEALEESDFECQWEG